MPCTRVAPLDQLDDARDLPEPYSFTAPVSEDT